MTMSAKEKLAALRAQFKPKEQNASFVGALPMYPFWNMKDGDRVVLRFLPDKDTTNVRDFLTEKVTHRLKIGGKDRNVPCLSMYGEPCPICKLSSDFYKAEDKINGKKYWRSKQHLAQCLIVEDPLPADPKTGETHKGKVRAISLGYQIFNILQEALLSEDDPIESLPYDMDEGIDFVIKRTKQGEYPSYVTGTKFNSRSRSLTEEERAEAEEHMIELHRLLPKNPGFDKTEALLAADVSGEDYQDSEESSTPPPPVQKRGSTMVPEDDGDDVPAPAPKRPVTESAPKRAPAPPAASADGDDEDDAEVAAMLQAIQRRRAG